MRTSADKQALERLSLLSKLMTLEDAPYDVDRPRAAIPLVRNRRGVSFDCTKIASWSRQGRQIASAII
jgi:hypothetical protein